MFTFLGRSVCLSVRRSVEKIEKVVKIGDFKHDQERKDDDDEEEDKDEKEEKDKEEKEEEKENNQDKDKVHGNNNDSNFFHSPQDIFLVTFLAFLMDWH